MHKKKWLSWVNVHGKTRQLALEFILMLQCSLPSAARVIPQGAAKACSRLNKLSSDTYTEGEPAQSANLCFLCNLLHTLICAESLARVLSLLTFDGRLLTVSKIYNNNNWPDFQLMMTDTCRTSFCRAPILVLKAY